MEKKRKYTPGFADAELAFNVLDKQEKAQRRKDWLEEHKKDKPTTKGGEVENENHRRSKD